MNMYQTLLDEFGSKTSLTHWPELEWRPAVTQERPSREMPHWVLLNLIGHRNMKLIYKSCVLSEAFTKNR